MLSSEWRGWFLTHNYLQEVMLSRSSWWRMTWSYISFACFRLIKEFDQEIKDEEARNPPEVNRQLNDEKQSIVSLLFFPLFYGHKHWISDLAWITSNFLASLNLHLFLLFPFADQRTKFIRGAEKNVRLSSFFILFFAWRKWSSYCCCY